MKLKNANRRHSILFMPASQHEQVDGMLERLKLTKERDRIAGAIAHGQKQRLEIGMLLMQRPQLLLLDEPTVGVDPLSRRELWEIIFQLVNKQELTVLLSTSYLDEAERCVQRLRDRRGAPVALDRVPYVLSECVRRDRAVGIRSEGTLIER